MTKRTKLRKALVYSVPFLALTGVLAASAILGTAKPVAANGAPANKTCYEITHCGGNTGCFTFITDDDSVKRGHAKHGDYYVQVSCPTN